jgi:hypothetical protein
LFTEAAVACVFKKLSEATARWYDAGERVERSAQHVKTVEKLEVNYRRMLLIK